MKRANARNDTRTNSRRNYYKRYIAHYTKRNFSVLLLGFLFVTGVIVGTLLVRSAGKDIMELLLRLMGDFSLKRRGQGFVENIFSGLLPSLQMLLLVFICGFCAIGQPVEIGMPLFRGLGFGFTAASLYAAYGAQAIGFVGLFILPGMILSTMALLFCSKEALRLSGSLWSIINGGEGPVYGLRIYCARFIAAVVVCAAAAAVEAVVYMLLPGAFLLY